MKLADVSDDVLLHIAECVGHSGLPLVCRRFWRATHGRFVCCCINYRRRDPAIVACLPYLQSVIAQVICTTDKQMVRLGYALQQCTRLHSINLHFPKPSKIYPVGALALAELGHMPQLRCLVLRHRFSVRRTDDCLASIATLTRAVSLRHLSLQFDCSRYLGRAGLQNLSQLWRLSTLESLSLGVSQCPRVQDGMGACLRSLAHCTTLVALSIDLYQPSSYQNTDASALLTLTRSPTLRSLTLRLRTSHTCLYYAPIALRTGACGLQTLHLTLCKSLLSNNHRLGSLTSAILGHPSIRDVALGLPFCRLQDEDLSPLADLGLSSMITTLALDVSHNEIVRTDALWGLGRETASFSRICIDLSHCHVDDAVRGLYARLGGKPRVRIIVAGNRHVSPETVALLHDAP